MAVGTQFGFQQSKMESQKTFCVNILECKLNIPTRLGTGEELPEVAQALQRQPHEPVNPHASW